MQTEDKCQLLKAWQRFDRQRRARLTVCSGREVGDNVADSYDVMTFGISFRDGSLFLFPFPALSRSLGETRCKLEREDVLLEGIGEKSRSVHRYRERTRRASSSVPTRSVRLVRCTLDMSARPIRQRSRSSIRHELESSMRRSSASWSPVRNRRMDQSLLEQSRCTLGSRARKKRLRRQKARACLPKSKPLAPCRACRGRIRSCNGLAEELVLYCESAARRSRGSGVVPIRDSRSHHRRSEGSKRVIESGMVS